ncbi:ATP-binding protein [Nitrospirillum sp. BR 11752]|uniref:ATP-binding protein n=1 Tax=Nitrospirillum sp. BR 11752 TaxID=3104293 RepID=UPI002ECA9BC7|nr:ATP-binding protein [Nitrospirillum sp. BR 11752]
MIIKSLILENFRSYRTRTIIPFTHLTGFIGRNDAGKSTILEALDIFFEGGVKKIEQSDANKGGDPKNVIIGIVFTELPEQFILDSNALTTLSAEYLLNADGDLEIHKTFNCSNQTPRPSIQAIAVHPNSAVAADILQKSQKDLRALIRERGLQNNCSQTENPSMRSALYQNIGDLDLRLRPVPLNEENGKAIWASLQNYIPIFALFQSDRPSSDQDPEVQNPMKIAIEQALEEQAAELDRISAEVQLKAQETAKRTLQKLQEFYPEIASTLEPKFKRPSWKTIFKLDLEADDGIPLNKRGSGVRRLVLLSFFQAEAEKRRTEAETGNGLRRKVVYAIEEPETSQHPDNQERIIKALRELADTGDQVIVTTHVPALAALIPVDSLRYVDRDPVSGAVRVRDGAGSEALYQEIADALGVLPDPLIKPGIKVAVLVEGKTDIDALRSMIQVLVEAGEIDAFDEGPVFWTIGGGDNTLSDWVERRYLDKLNVPQVMIQDSDRTNAALPIAANKEQWLRDMQNRRNVWPFLTRKRSMDNYLHPDVIPRLTNNLLNLPADIDIDYIKMADEFSIHLTRARENARVTGFSYRPTEHNGTCITKTSATACKRIICAHIMRHMTADEIRIRATYQENGADRHEVREWIDAIRQHL